MNTPRLIESCLESGAMTEEQMRTALKGTRHWPAVRAMVSLIETYLAAAGEEGEVRGQEARIRDECAGARRWLKDLRRELKEMATEKVDEEEKAR